MPAYARPAPPALKHLRGKMALIVEIRRSIDIELNCDTLRNQSTDRLNGEIYAF